ncbi:MAG: ABC transporter ATP-binding protein, partial [Acidobacteriota bacterium]
MSLRHHDPSRRKRPSGTAGWLLAELAPHAAELSLAVVLLCASSGLLALGPYLVRHAIDVDIAGRDAAGLARTVLLYLGVEVLNLGLIYGLRLWLERIGQAILATLKKRLFAHVIALPLSFHDRQSPGKLLSRIQNDTQALRALFSSSAVTILGDVLMMAIVLVVMLAVSPRLTLVALSVLPTVLLFSTFFHRKTHPIFLSMRGLTAEVTAALTEMLSGSAVIRAYERRRWAAARLQEKNE